MTEPIDQATKWIIREEARKFASFLTAPNELEKFHHIHTGYVKGASVWAEKLKQKDELLQSIRHKLYSRDTDDAIIHEINELLTEGGYPYETED